MKKKKHIAIRLEGKVQGVSFRETTKYIADHIGVRGFVRNEKDGSLYIEAEAEQWELDTFVEWCNEGPDRAHVETCEVRDGELKNYENFEIVKK